MKRDCYIRKPESRFGRLAVLLAFVVFSLLLVSCISPQTRAEADAKFKLGQSHLISGSNQAAFVKFHEALKIDPKHMDALNGLGYVHMSLREYDKAEEYFLKAVAVDKEFSEAYNNLCFTYYQGGRYHKAIDACNKAVENPLYPTPERAYYNIGRSYYKLKKYDESVAAFEQAVARHPNFFQGYYAVALSYNGMRMYSKASKSMGIAIGLDPRFQGNKKLAEDNFRAMKREGVIDPLEADQFIEILHY